MGCIMLFLFLIIALEILLLDKEQRESDYMDHIFTQNAKMKTMDRVVNFRRPAHEHSAKERRSSNNNTLSKTSKLFLVLSCLEVFLVGGLQCGMISVGDFRHIKHAGMGPERRVYMSLFLGSVVYMCLFSLLAVRTENFLEVIAFVIQHYLFVVYGVFQVYHVVFKKLNVNIIRSETLSTLAYANLGLLVVFTLASTYLAFQLYHEYGWKIYKRVRFNVRLRAAYYYYELVTCLMKFTLLYVSMIAILVNRTIALDATYEFLYIISIILIPLVLLALFLVLYGIRHENKLIMWIFLFILLGSQGAILYEIYSLLNRSCYNCPEYFAKIKGYGIIDEVISHLIYLASVAWICIIALTGTSIKVFMNFGIGLRDHFAGTKSSSTIFFTEFVRSIFPNTITESNRNTYGDDDVETNSHSIQINISSEDDEYVSRGNFENQQSYNDGSSYLVTSFDNEAFCSCGIPLGECPHRRESIDSRRTSSSTTAEELQFHMLQVKNTTSPNLGRSISVPCPRANSQRPSVMDRLSSHATDQMNTIYLRNISFQSVSKHTNCCGCFTWRKTKTRTSSFGVYGGNSRSPQKRSENTIISEISVNNKHSSITSLPTSSIDVGVKRIPRANRRTMRKTKELPTSEVILEHEEEENAEVDDGKCSESHEETLEVDDGNDTNVQSETVDLKLGKHCRSFIRHNHQTSGRQILTYLKVNNLFHRHHHHNHRHRHRHRLHGKAMRSRSIDGIPSLQRESFTDFYSDNLDLQKVLASSEEHEDGKPMFIENERRRSRSLSSIEDLIVSPWWRAGYDGPNLPDGV